ncbi:MAG: nuclear transport factor 2 family protein [Lachnospiraceae bacterium]|nr:nuclear transport factor 2 family protein [Lachnospiraceae bacterium]
MDIKEYELRMWEAAKNRDVEAFLSVVDKEAVMVCGGFRCSGAEYGEIIKDFDLAGYEITGFEKVAETADMCQVHYVITTTVADERNKDLEGTFHITSTWKKTGDEWKLVFNMDSRVD